MFLQKGKHVLAEKPLTEDFAEAKELVSLAEANGVSLAVNQTRRFFPTYQKIRDLIQEGLLGTLQSIVYHDGVEFDWPAASPHHFSPNAKGAWSDTGVHLLDSVCYWLGAAPELVEARMDAYGGPEAMATVRLRLNECDAEIKVSRLGRLINGFVIEGTLGRIQAGAEDFGKITVECKDGRQKTYKCGPSNVQYTDFAIPMLQNFVEVCAGEAEPTVTGKSCLTTIDLLQQAYDVAKPYPTPWNDALVGDHHPATDAGRYGSVSVTTKPKVLVTGASGFLGGRLMEQMLITETASPIGTIRQWSRAARPARFAAELVLCDIADPRSINEAMRGVDAVVHCAYTGDRESIVDGTRNLLDASERAGVQRFVYLSSAEAYANEVEGDCTEDAAVAQRGSNDYGTLKAEAEQLCREHKMGSRVSILRPSLIYGPFGVSWTVDIAKRLLSGKWGQFDQSNGFANLVYVDDLVQVILACLTEESALGETFNVNGPDRLTWNEYFERFNVALGQSDLKRISSTKSQIRTKVMDGVGAVADKILDRFEDPIMEIYMRGGLASKVMKKIKGELDATPTGQELNDLYSRNIFYDDSKAKQILGYQPQFDLDRGLGLSIQWLRLHEVIGKAKSE